MHADRWINTSNEQQLLQEDLDALYKWYETWQLLFHPDKCKVLSLGNRPLDNKTKLHLYTWEDNGALMDACLGQVSEKDIRVIIDNKLSFRKQIKFRTTKANTTMGIIRWTFVSMDKHSFKLLYRSMVRPHLEVSDSVWIPHHKQDIDTMEQEQKRVANYIPCFKDLPYGQRLGLLGLPTLTDRRVHRDMKETYKILTDIYNVEVVPNLSKGNKNPRDHNKKQLRRGATNLNCRN